MLLPSPNAMALQCQGPCLVTKAVLVVNSTRFPNVTLFCITETCLRDSTWLLKMGDVRNDLIMTLNT